MHTGSWTITTITMMVVAISVGGCGDSEPTIPVEPTPTVVVLDAGELLSDSGVVMQGLSTFNFVLDHDVGDLELLPGVRIKKANGKVVNPDRLAIEFSGTFGGSIAIESTVISIGSRTYMTNPLTGEWTVADDTVSPLGFFSPTQGVSQMIAQLYQVTFTDDDRGDGKYGLKGKLPVEALAPLVGKTRAGGHVQVEVTIDAVTSHLIDAKFIGPVTPADIDNVQRTITISLFDQEVTIEPPKDSP